jgi:hypothetical protein
MFVKPGPNPELPGTTLKVRIPHTYALMDDAGAEVPEDGFWLQRLRQGDVVRADPPAQDSEPDPDPAPEHEGAV